MEIINFRVLDTIDLIIIAILITAFLIQLRYFFIYLKLSLHKTKIIEGNSIPVSILMPVRNEESRIMGIVSKFDKLDSKDYQLVIINEYSEDNTLDFLNVLSETNPKLKVTSLSQETRFSDKQVINIGLKSATAQYIIVLTSLSGEINPGWLSGLIGQIDEDTDAVISYSNSIRKKGLRNLICRLERFSQFMISGSWTLAGSPFVFTQENVLFSKQLYFNTTGFRQKLNRSFANLELVFNENFKKSSVKVTTNPDLAIRENIEDDRGDHVKYIKKGIQIRQSLSFIKKTSLFIDDFSKILIPTLTSLIIVLNPEYWITFSVIFLLHILLVATTIKILLNRLNEKKIFLTSLVYAYLKPLINWWFVCSIYIIHRRNKWN